MKTVAPGDLVAWRSCPASLYLPNFPVPSWSHLLSTLPSQCQSLYSPSLKGHPSLLPPGMCCLKNARQVRNPKYCLPNQDSTTVTSIDLNAIRSLHFCFLVREMEKTIPARHTPCCDNGHTHCPIGMLWATTLVWIVVVSSNMCSVTISSISVNRFYQQWKIF